MEIRVSDKTTSERNNDDLLCLKHQLRRSHPKARGHAITQATASISEDLRKGSVVDKLRISFQYPRSNSSRRRSNVPVPSFSQIKFTCLDS